VFKIYQSERLKNAYDPKSCKDLKNKCLNLYMLHGFEIVTHGNEMTSNIEIDNHYEKSCLPKPHYLATKIQKNSYTIIMQLSLGHYNYYVTITLEIRCINK
jgi:hypothetical protein